MNIQQRLKGPLYALIALAFTITSCSKELNTETTESGSSDAIAVLASETASISANLSTAADSVYVIQPCARGEKREIVAETNLPSGITEYLTANYAGYSFHKAFDIKSSDLATTGYVVIVYYNDKPVGLQFDVEGNFVKAKTIY